MEWKDFFNIVKEKPYSKTLHAFLDDEYRRHTCYPPRTLVFNAFNLTPLEEVKVVIIGQDPYHEPQQAMGLAFSVPNGIPLPPSLQNIYKEIDNDLGLKMKGEGDLTYLAKQGVLLLNARLSVRRGIPLSHDVKEYQLFLTDVMELLDRQNQPIVFMLWGNFARSLKKLLQNKNHLILESTHPSPLSANRGGFFNTHQFSRANQYLKDHGLPPIDWQN
jgi:uracil-DNA glycosylase